MLFAFSKYFTPLKERNNNLTKEETYRKRKTNKMDYEHNKSKLQTYQRKNMQKRRLTSKNSKTYSKILKRKTYLHQKEKVKQ